MGHFTHPSERLLPDLRNIPPSPFSLASNTQSLFIHLSFFFALLKWLISCSPPWYPQQLSSRTSWRRRARHDARGD
ncbi:hypothetical protein EMIT0P291_200024 [Pseudomonas sp. IT-P291]